MANRDQIEGRESCLPNDIPATAGAVAAAVRRGELDPIDVVAAARARHGETDHRINAVVQWFDQPVVGTDPGSGNGPLAGVPFLAKDYGSAVAGQLVEMGSRLAAGNRAGQTAVFMKRLLAAGAIVVGRSAVPEFIQHGTTESRVNGATRNPHDLNLSAGGSSGGAAAAVAAGVVPFAHASDCAGSIRIPAAVCGLVGLKPGAGRIPWQGAAAASDWGGIATEFVVTATVDDARLLLDVLADGEFQPPKPSCRIALSTDHWAGAKPDSEVVSATRRAATRLEDVGHHIVEIDPPVDHDEVMDTWFPIFGRPIAVEAAELSQRLGRAIDESTVEPATLAVLDQVGRCTEADLARAQSMRSDIGRRLDERLDGFDVLLTPTLGRATIPLGRVAGEIADMDEYVRLNDEIFCYNYPFNLTGWASMSVPFTSTRAGTPLAVQLTARPGGEHQLLALADALTA